jgi:hypothetical protein
MIEDLTNYAYAFLVIPVAAIVFGTLVHAMLRKPPKEPVDPAPDSHWMTGGYDK